MTVAPFLKRFRRDLIGIGWILAGLFLAIALFSYDPRDPSLNSIGRGGAVTNDCGYLGSFIADLAYQAFGFSSWLIVLIFLKTGGSLIFGLESPMKGFAKWIWGTIFVLTLSTMLTFYFSGETYYQGQILIGGVVGHGITHLLVNVINRTGVGLLMWGLVLVLSVLYTGKGVSDLLLSAWQFAMKSQKKTWSWWTDWWAKDKSSDLLDLGQEITKKERFAFSFPVKVKDPTEKSDDSIQRELKISPTMITKPCDVTEQTQAIKLFNQELRGDEEWKLPDLNLIEAPPLVRNRISEDEIKGRAALLCDKLSQFSVHGEVVGASTGPVVTLYEFRPRADVRISKITDLADDLSLALSSKSVRIIAPIPGRDVVGIETANSQRESVYLKEILVSKEFWSKSIALPLPLGKRVNGETRVVDLRKMPHLLVAGTTGSGKSVFVVCSLLALLCRHTPKALRLILIDPKQVELGLFEKVPHLLMPPVREPKHAVRALKWAVREMEKRYRSMSLFGSRDLEGFNETVHALTKEQRIEHEERSKKREAANPGEGYYFSVQPMIVVVVEEFGDLMSVDKVNVEHTVVRLAQMARACGIHLILAMQSPRKDVVTGLIKTNIPGRISFKVASKMDSRIILDESGAERLLAQGDMLYLAPGVAKPERHHGPWIQEECVKKIIHFWAEQGEPTYSESALRIAEDGDKDLSTESEDSFEDFGSDEMYDEILAFVSTQKEISASYLQRRFRLGYPRAARVIERFERDGVIGPPNGSKPRQVLVNQMK